MKKGQEQSTEIMHSSYNFHLHPKEAYVDHKVLLGWPSSQDYLTFLSSTFAYDVIFHVVVSLEGLYIICLNDYFYENYKDIKKLDKYVEDEYEVEQGRRKDNYSYLKKMNNKKHSIFIVQFLNWKSASKKFSVYFKKIEGRCNVKLK